MPRDSLDSLAFGYALVEAATKEKHKDEAREDEVLPGCVDLWA
jgi:hypothetical protein